MPDRVIQDLVDVGLRGVETWHPQHNSGTVRRYRALAQRLNLLETGGSDFHGEGRSADLGDIPVPERVFAALQRAVPARG
jgi:predicted metal-dependent phosphoesterase TrpH